MERKINKTFGNVSLPKESYHLLKDDGKQSLIIIQTVSEVTERANSWHILAKSDCIQNGNNDLIPLKEKQLDGLYEIRIQNYTD